MIATEDVVLAEGGARRLNGYLAPPVDVDDVS
jgi:hypothetical protein